MRYFFLAALLLTTAVSWSQDTHIELLEGFQNDCLTCKEAFSIGNGYMIRECEHDVFISNPLGECLNISNYAIIDEITSALWIDMNGDQELDLVLETYYGNGRSGWQGGHGEQVKSSYVIDVVNTQILFTWDYYLHFEYWDNEVDWTNEEEPEITGGTGGTATSYHMLNYSEGLIIGTLELDEATGDELDEEYEPLPSVLCFKWNGASFEHVHLTPSVVDD